MGNISLRTTCIMPINHVGRLYALAFTHDGFTISYTTIAYIRGEIVFKHNDTELSESTATVSV